MKEFLQRCRTYFLFAGIFSFFVNLLMLSLPLYILQIFDRVITSRSLETLMMLTIGTIGALVILMTLDMLRSRLLLGAGVALDELAGPKVITGLLKAGVKPGSNTFYAGLRDVAILRGFLTGNSIISLFDSPWAPFYIFIIFFFHFYLGIAALTGALLLFLMGYINDAITRQPLDEMNKASRRASAFIDSGLRNAEVINALGMLDDLTRRWRRLNAEVINNQVQGAKRSGTIGSITKFLRLSIQAISMCIGAYLVIQQHVSAGIMMASTLLLARALAPVESAIVTWKGLVDALQSYHALNDLLASVTPEDVAVALPVPKGKLEVDRVIFAMPGGERPILRGVSFKLDPGESLGLIGPSAAGKSTLARVITGIWRPVAGIVRLDGADVATWPRDQIGPHIGYLPQDVELFSGTVAENIARLKEPDTEEVLSASGRAHVHELILRLPKGYENEIGPGGVVLSAGQRQRIALARCLYGDPRLVILDEPNANLDTEGEEALVKTMQQLKQDGVTLIIISHRPGLLAAVDKLLVLREGIVDAFGPRNEIMQRITPRPVLADAPQVVISRGGGS